MPKYNHHFTVLSPPIARDELPNLKILGTIEYVTETSHTLYIRLQGRPSSVDVISVTIPDDSPHELHGEWLKHIVEHMITTLRLTYNGEVNVFYFRDGFVNAVMQTENIEELCCLSITFTPWNLPVNAGNICGVFRDSVEDRPADILALVAEGQMPTLPNHYKLLSLYRALELLMLNKKHLRSWLDKYENDFRTLGFGGKDFKQALADLRNRCAHGMIDGNRGSIRKSQKSPIMGVGYGDSDNLIKILPLLRRCLCDAIRKEFDLDIMNDRPFQSGVPEP